MKNKVSLASRLYMVLIFIFLYAPIAVMTVFSFNSGSSTYIMDGFSTSWWAEMFHDTAAMNALKNTVLLALVTMVVSTVLGVMASVGLFMQKNRLYKKTMMNVTNIPMMNPDLNDAFVCICRCTCQCKRGARFRYTSHCPCYILFAVCYFECYAKTSSVRYECLRSGGRPRL